MVELEILLATYNGERFLQEQLDSLENQTFSDWNIVIRDDGSTDNTLNILKAFKEKYPDKVRIIEDNHGQLRPCLNFGELMVQSSAPYIMFCDQDDVWNNDKIEKSLTRIKEIESTNGARLPILVHTDLEVVDDSLKTINKSFMDWHKFDTRKSGFNSLLMTNVITGCSAILNRALVEKVGYIPIEARMHDTWLGLVASAFGVIDFISEPTMKYRIHDANVVGERNLDLSNGIKKAKETVNAMLLANILQAEVFLNIYGDNLSFEQQQILNKFIALKHSGFFNKRVSIIRNGFFKHGFKDNMGLLLLA